jgi:hypothetical protein
MVNHIGAEKVRDKKKEIISSGGYKTIGLVGSTKIRKALEDVFSAELAGLVMSPT